MGWVYGISLGTYGSENVTKVMGEGVGGLPSAKYTSILNEAGTAEFTLPPAHAGYSEITPMKTTVQIAEIDDVVWTGRVTRVRTDWLNRLIVTCEGSLAFFNDSIQPYNQWYNISLRELITDLIKEHNRQVTEDRQFEVSDITARPDDEKINYFETNGESTMRVVQSLLSEYGGYIYIWLSVNNPGKYYFFWLKEWTDTSSQEIGYGINLLDLATDNDMTNLVTCIFPQGEDVEVIQPAYKVDDYGDVLIGDDGKPIRAKYVDEDGNETDEDAEEIVELPLTLDMVEEETPEEDDDDDSGGTIVIPASTKPVQAMLLAAAESGSSDSASDDSDEPTPIQYRIPQKTSTELVDDERFIDTKFVEKYGRIVRAIKFNGVTKLSELKQKATEWIEKQEADGVTIEVSAADLRFIDNALGDLRVGKKVNVVSGPHGIRDVMTITKVSVDMTKVSKKITVGQLPRKTLSNIAGRSGGVTEVDLGIKLKWRRGDITQKDVADGGIIFIPE